MNRTGIPTVTELMALLAANATEIAVLKAEKEVLAQRVFKLEEELALAQLHRFAPRSEKHVDRVFNEAEQAVLEGDADQGSADADEAASVDLPDTGLPDTEKPEGKKRGRRPLPTNLPRDALPRLKCSRDPTRCLTQNVPHRCGRGGGKHGADQHGDAR